MNPEQYQELVRQINSLQQQIDALVKPEVGRWVDWTPTITQGVAVTLTITYARYCVKDGVATVQAYLAATSNGTAGQAIVIGGQPAIMQPSNLGILATLGSGIVADQSVAWYPSILIANNTAVNWRFVATDGTASNYVGASPSFGLVNGDLIIFDASYEC